MNLSDFYFKKLGKLIEDPDYDLNEKYAPKLLDAGFIKLVGFRKLFLEFKLFFEIYIPTKKGKEAYKEWKENAEVMGLKMQEIRDAIENNRNRDG